ncbi:TetR family transcriptional regulator [Mycobacterium alsense]|nr:TetR family transcriptional regulator [Mycobacterium alsense]
MRLYSRRVERPRLFAYEPPPPAEPSSEERIRDAALERFATHGVAATSLAKVAEAAGVSIGLVQHYYGTKAALVAAVDQHVLRILGDGLESADLPGQPAGALAEAGHQLTGLVAENPLVMDYLAHALCERAEVGSVIFDGLIGISTAQRDHFAEHGLTRPDLDPEWAVLNPLILRVGALILRPHIERYLGKPLFDDAQLQRWDRAVTGLIQEGQFR